MRGYKQKRKKQLPSGEVVEEDEPEVNAREILAEEREKVEAVPESTQGSKAQRPRDVSKRRSSLDEEDPMADYFAQKRKKRGDTARDE